MSFLTSYKKDNFASSITDMWHQLSSERNAYMHRSADARKYITAPDTSYTENGKLPWKNRTVIPKMTQIVDNLDAQYMQAWIPNDDWVSFMGYSNEDIERESLVEQYLRYKLEQSDFRSTLRKLAHDYSTYGMSCVGVEHVHEKVRSLVTGDEVTKYYGPKAYRVSPYDYVIEPRANSFDESVFIRRSLVPLNKLLKHNETASTIKYNEDTLKKMSTIRSYTMEQEDWLKESGLYVDGFTSPQEYFMSNMVEVLEFWGDIIDSETGELFENHTVAVVDRMYNLYETPNPMWNGKRPYTITGWRERADNLYAQSPIEQLVGMQYRIDHLENLKADILDLTAHPIVVVSGNPSEDFEWAPGEVFYAGEEGTANILRPDASALQMDTEIEYYFSVMEEMAGAPKQTAGFRTPGEKTAFEVDQLQQGAMKMFLEKSKHFEDTLIEPFLENFYTLMAMNWNAEDIIRAFDKDTEALKIINVDKNDVIREGKIKAVGSKHYEKRRRDLQNIRDAVGVMSSNEMTAMHIDGLAIDRFIEKNLDLEKDAIVKPFKAVTDQVDAQMVQQTHAQEAQQTVNDFGGANAPEQAATPQQ